ncbi:MAG: hypothetical protein ACW99R_19010 [Candidatus Hodarchaeales archaeon]|jgi:DNA-binding transcriptional ArsR family regulator
MNQLENQLFSVITDDIPLLILSELIMEEELSVYDFNTRTYSIAQLRYTLKKLIEYNLLLSKQQGKRVYYSLTREYKRKIQSILACYFSFSSQNIRSILKNFDGWAFRDKSALSFYVPFLTLVTSRDMISVRSIKEKEKLHRLLPNIEEILDIKIQPTYFRRTDQYLRRIKGFPVLSPETIFPGLLKSNDSRVQLASIFLLPHMDPKRFFKTINREERVFLTTIYLLFALEDYLQEDRFTLSRNYLRIWFHNNDNLDFRLKFDSFLAKFHRLQRRKVHTSNLFKNLLKSTKKLQHRYTKWDRAADLVPDRLVSFNPEALSELMLINA